MHAQYIDLSIYRYIVEVLMRNTSTIYECIYNSITITTIIIIIILLVITRS